MPLEAFRHLEPQKKERLLAAARREFSEHPYERVSVFNIMKGAGVSRSGFYYYFKDKEDLYRYLLEQLRAEFERELRDDQSVLDIHRAVFDFFAKFKGTERQNLIFRVLENMKPAVQNLFAKSLVRPPTFDARFRLRDMEKLKAGSARDYGFFAFMVMSCTMNALKVYYETDEPAGEIRARLDRGIDYLKYGILKEAYR